MAVQVKRGIALEGFLQAAHRLDAVNAEMPNSIIVLGVTAYQIAAWTEKNAVGVDASKTRRGIPLATIAYLHPEGGFQRPVDLLQSSEIIDAARTRSTDMPARFKRSFRIGLSAPQLSRRMQNGQSITQPLQRPDLGQGTVAVRTPDTHLQRGELIIANALQVEQPLISAEGPPFPPGRFIDCYADRREDFFERTRHALRTAMVHAKGRLDILQANTRLANRCHVGETHQLLRLGERGHRA